MESLESRLAPATITGTTALVYTAGTGINNNVSVTISGSNFVFNDTAETITTSVAGATGSGTNTVDIPTSGVTAVTLSLLDGADTISSTGVVLTTQALTITGTGSLTVNGPISTTTGAVSISSAGALTLSANVGGTTETSTIALSANTAGTGSAGLSETAGVIQTTNATATAVAITVNTSSGGTGNASIDNVADSGTLAVNTFGGSILYAGTNTLDQYEQGIMGDGGTIPTRVIGAKTFTFTTLNTAGATGSVGTAARPLQLNSATASGTLTATAGSGGVYAVEWGTVGSETLSLAGASATGAGNILVVTANASGHNLTVTGPVTTGSGSVLLAADDNFTLSAAIGGSGFSGTVYLGANRDQGNAGNLLMTAGSGSITTTNATASAVRLEDYGGVTGTVTGILTLGNITVGNGGTITATTVPTLGINDPAAPTSNGEIIAGSTSVVLSAGTNGTVVLTAAATTGTTDTAGIGTAASPIVVSAGTVNVTNTSSISVATDSVFVTANSAATITATVAGTSAGTLNLIDTSGILSIGGASTAGGGAINVTDSSAGIAVNGALGSSGSGAIALNAGTSNVAFYANDTLFNTDLVTVTAGTPAELKSGSTITLSSGQITSASGVQVDNGATLAGTGTIAGALSIDGILAPSASTFGLTASSLTLHTDGSLQVALNGTGTGQFSTVNVSGAIVLVNAPLVINAVSTLTAGQAFQFINNTGGTTISGTFSNTSFVAVNNPGISFSMNYAGGGGNNGVLTVLQVAQVDVFNIVSGNGTLAAPIGTANSLTVSISGSSYVINDTATTISLTTSASAAGWTNTNANTITGLTSSLTALTLNTSDGSDLVAFSSLNLGATSLTISGSGSLEVDGNVTTSGNISITGYANITDGVTGTPGTLTGGTISLTASTGIGSATNNVLTAGTTITAAAGSGGVYLTQTGTASVTATATGAGNISITDNSGTLTIAGAVTTATGNIALASAGGLNVNANVNPGSGTITLSADTAGSGPAGYTQATTATLTTTNTSASAVTINVNTAGGGTGAAAVGNASVGSSAGGYYTVNAHAGSILWNNTAVARSAASATNVISAYGFSFTDTGAGGVGTSVAPMQISGLVPNTPFSASAGSGGIYATEFSADALQVNQAIATGAGNINIETSNASLHDLLINGTVTTGSGSITLYADDNLILNGASAPVYDTATNGTATNALVGGSGFSGTVDIEANLDAGNEQSLIMSAGSAIVTSNSTASAVLLESYSGDGSTPATINDGGVQLGNVTVGAGGTITVNAPAGTATGKEGDITQLTGTLLDTSGGAGTTYGSVILSTVAYDTTGDGQATAGYGQGDIGVGGTVSTPVQMPIMVKAATVVASTTGTNLANTGNINISDAVAGSFTATTSGNATGTINLATTSGVLTIAGATSTAGGSLTLTGAGGVALNAQLGGSTSGAIAINGPLSGSGNIQMGTGAVTVTQNTNSTYAGSISGTHNLIIAGTGALSLTGTSGYSGATQINSGQLLVDSPGSIAASTTVNSTGTLGGTGSAPAVVVAGGTVNPGDPVTADGILTLASADFSNGGDLRLNIGGFTTAGTNFDQLNLGAGLLNLGGTSTLTLDLNGLSSTGTATNVILGSNITGTFTTVNVVNNPNGFVPVLQYTASGLTIVIQAVATHFQVSASPGSVTAGGNTTVTVTALDAFNNVAPSYTGTVHLTSSDGQAIFATNNVGLTNGVGTFTVTLETAGGQTVSATDTVASTLTGTSSSILVSPAALSGFTVTNTPASVAAGASFAFTIRAHDPYGNTVTSFGGSVNLTTTDTGTSTSVPASASFTSGVSSVNATLTSVGSQTISATNGTLSATSNAINVTPGAVSQFVFSGTPTGSTVAGTTFLFSVTAEDAYGNPVTSFNGPVTFSSTDTNAQTQLPTGSSLTNGGGTFSATLTWAGSQTISVSAGSVSGTSGAIVIAPAGINHFAVTNTPASAGAGVPFTFTVTAQDLYNNTVPTFAGSVSFTSSDPNGQIQLPASSTLTSGVGSFSAALDTLGNQTITATSGAATGVSSAINVTPGVASHFVITGTPAGTVTAGTSFTFTVTAEDAFNHTVTGYTGPVVFSSTDINSQTSLPGSSSLTNGVGTFSATLTRAGTQTITVAAAGNSSINGTSASITVTFATLSRFGVTGTPASIAAGTTFTFTVAAQDQYGNTVTTFNGPASLTTTDTNTQTVLPTSATLANGVSSPVTAKLTRVGSQTITAGNGFFTGTSAAIVVTPGALDHFTLTGTPTSSLVAGTSFAFTVTALDLYGNTLTGYTGPVAFTSSDTNAQTVLPSSSPLTAGVGAFNATLTTAGSQTITVHAGSSVGTSSAILVTPAAVNHLALTGTPTSSVTAGTSFSFTVTAEDTYNNTVPGYAGTIHFSSTDANAQTSLPANSTLTNGVGAFSAVLTHAGSQTLTATDTVTSAIVGTSPAVTVTFAALNHFAVTGTPTSIGAGTAFTFAVTALDLYGNTVGSFNSTAALSSTDTNAQTLLPGSAAFTNGVSSVSATLTLAGSRTITAGANSFAGTSAAILVTPAALNHFALTGTPTPSISAGQSFSFGVTAQDAYGNTVTSYGGTVSFTTTDANPQSSVPAPAALVNGVGGFSATLDQAGSQTISANAGAIVGTSNSIQVTAAALNHFAITGTPTDADTAGTAFTFNVTAQDVFNNTLAGYAGTVAFNSTDANAQTNLPAPTALVNGVGSFSATLTKAGSQTITVSAASITGTSNSINVVAAAVNHLAVAGTPTGRTAGTAFSFTVTAQDLYNNTVTGYGGTVAFSSTDTNAQTSLPASSPLSAGVGNFSATLTRAGAQTISASAGTIAGTSSSILVAASAFNHFALTGTPTNITAGTAFSFSVFAQDLYGNTVPSYAGPVSFTTTDTNPASSLPVGAALANGVGNFSATLDQAGTQTITVSNGSQTATSAAINVTAAALDHFVVSGTPTAAVTAGTAFSFTVTAQDAYNNTVTAFAGTVTFTSTDTHAQTSLPTPSTLSAGVGTFTATLTTAGAQTITAADGSSFGTSSAITVTPAGLNHFAVTGTPSSVTAGTPFSFAVAAKDVYNNTVSSYAGTVSLTSTDHNTQTTLPAGGALSAGTANFTADLTLAGTETITASSNSITGTSASITVTPAGLDHFALTGTPTAAVVAGTPFSFGVTAEDVYNNTVTGLAGTVTFSSTDTNLQTSLPAASSLTNGVGTFPATLTTAGSQTITASDGSAVGSSSPVNVTPASLNHFALTGTPASSVAGAAFSFTVKAEDTYGNTVPTFDGSVGFTSSDTNAATSLPANGALTNGVGSFTATLTDAGAQTISASAASITGVSNTIIVTPAGLDHFALSGTPTPITAGVSFPFTVTAQDRYENTVVGFTGTISFQSSDTNAQTSLPAADSSLSGGVGTFNATLTRAGNQTITVADDATSAIAGTSAAIAVHAAAASHFAVSAPASGGAGNAFTFSITALDPYGNTALGYAGTVHFSSTDNNVQTSLPANSPLSSGVGSFSATLTKAGTQTITAGDTVNSITGSGSVVIAAAGATHFALSAPAGATAGSAFTIGVTALDTYGNTAAGYSGTVHFTSSDASAQTPADATLSAGAGSFSVTLITAGTQTVTATDSVSSSITGGSSIAVTAAAATHFIVSVPASAQAGTAFVFTVTARDQFNNTATTYGGAVTFSSTDTNGLTLLPTPSPLSAGVGSFSATLTRAGVQTITASDAGASISQTSSAITVHAAAASHYFISAPSAATAGSAFTFTVTAEDPFGNTDTTYDGAAHFTSSDANAQTALPANSVLASGVVSVSATLTRAGTQTITATDTGAASITGTTSITVQAAAPTHFSVSAPAGATAGSAFTFTVTALDSYNNTAAGYTGTVSFGSTDTNGQTQLPGNSALTNGAGVFSATLTKAGAQTISAVDADDSLTGISGTIAVAAAGATHYFVSAPANATAGNAFAFTVTAQDPYNNTAVGYSGTVAFSSTDPNALTNLPASSTLSAGVGTFSATLTKAGPQTITAADSVFSSITSASNTIAVAAAAATHLVVSAPGSAVAGVGFTFTVTAQDSFGNTATSDNDDVTFTSSDTGAQTSLPAGAALTAGSGIFSAALTRAGSQTISAADALHPTLAGISGAINVGASLATHFAVTTPASAAAGVSFSFSVTALDAYNNTAVGYAGLVHFTSSDTGGQTTLPADRSLTNGAGTFSATLTAAGNQTIRAADSGASSISGTSGLISVSAAAATHYVVSAPGAATAGSAVTFTVTADDAFGNTAVAYGGTVHFTSTDAAASLPADTALSNGFGTFSATLTTSGPQTITAAAASTALTGTSASITVSAAAATHFVVSAPTGATAGSAFVVSVTAFDPYNNLAKGYGGTIHFTSSDTNAQTSLPADAELTNGAGTFSVALTKAGSQTITVTDTQIPAVTGVSGSISVSAAAVSQLLVAAPSLVTASTAFTFTVTAADPFGNAVVGYGGTVHFSSSDALATLPANTTLTNGTGSFSAVLKTTGFQTLTAKDTASTTITGTSGSIGVAGLASHFVVSAPAATAAGAAFSFTVTALDALNVTASNYNGTVHFTSSDPLAVLSGNVTLTDGVGTFTAALKTAGDQTLTATDTVSPSVTGGATIDVSPLAATHFSVNVPPSATAGVPFTATVIAEDIYNNTAISFNDSVHLTSSDAHSVLPADSVLTAGVGSFSITLDTAGNQTLTATDTVNSALNGTSGNVNVRAIVATHYLVSAPSSVTAGIPFTFTVTALDSFNNLVSGYNGIVDFSSSDAQGVLPGGAALTNGVGTFSATFKTAGNQTLTALDSSSPAISGAADNISVGAASIAHFAFSPVAGAITGVAFNFTLTAQDAFNNTVLGYTGTVHFTSSDARAVLPASAAITGGVGTFSATLKTVGAETLTATDTGLASTASTSAPISVTGAVSHFAFSPLGTVTAGGAFTFTVTAEDQFDNTVSAYDGAVGFTSGDAQASVPGVGTLIDGIGNFVATLRTAGVQSLVVADTGNGALSGFTNVTVAAGAATHFAFNTPATAIAGTSFTVMVSALDAFNNVAAGYNGTVRFSTSDNSPQAILPPSSTLTAGVGSFSVTLATAGKQTLNVNDTASTLAASGTILVSAGAASKFLLTGTPAGSVPAGTAFNFTVTALDADNNLANGYTGTVHFTSTDNNKQTLLPADTTLTGGAGTFTATLTTAGPQTITATDLLNAGIAGTSTAVHVVSGAVATSLTVSAPANVKAGTIFGLTVTARDTYGNAASGYTGTIHFTSSDATGVLPGNYTFTTNNDGAETFNLTLKTNGSQTVTVTDTANSALSAVKSIVVSGAATHFLLSAPSTATAGVPFTFTVTALDASGNTAAGYTGTVHFTSTDSGANLPLNTSLTGGTGTFTAVLTKAGAITLTASDTAAPGTLVSTKSITVSAGAATHFVATGPATAVAGTAFAFTLTAKDAYNNTALGYTGTIQFTSSDPAASLPANTTLTNGVGSFHATLKTAGVETWTAADNAAASVDAVTNITVSPGAVARFTVTAPAGATAGAAFAITITGFDAFGNEATNFSGAVHLSSSDAKVVFPASNVALAKGVGSFNVTLKTSGAQTITAAATTSAAVNGSASVAVNAAAATHLVVSAPKNAAAGTPVAFTVAAEDAFNNIAPSYAGTVHISSTDAQASLLANTLLSNGVATLNITFGTKGNQTLTASDTVTTSITGIGGAIAVTPGATTRFSIAAPTIAVGGTPVKITVTALDAFGNTTTGYTGTVDFSSSDPAAILPANATLTNGVGTFSAILSTSGAQTIDAADSLNNSVAGASNSIAVSNTAAGFAIQPLSGTVTAGATLTFTVIALDGSGNTATSYTGTVQLTSSDPTAIFAANNVKLTKGVGTFKVTLKTAGTQSITATDSANGSITGTNATVTVLAAAATHLVIGGTPTGGIAAGTPFPFTVTAEDAYGNTATTYGGTIRFTSSDANAQTTLPGLATLTNGVGTFSATLTRAGTQTLTALDAGNKAIAAGSSPIHVSADVADSLVLSAPSGASSKSAITITVMALDQYGNIATSYNDSVQVTSSDASAALPAAKSLIGGVGTFSVTFNTNGEQTLTATDISTFAFTTTSGSIEVGMGRDN